MILSLKSKDGEGQFPSPAFGSTLRERAEGEGRYINTVPVIMLKLPIRNHDEMKIGSENDEQ